MMDKVLKGFIEGLAVDSITWITTAYFPQLANPSPLKIPGYDPRGIHWDDLISLGVSAGFIGLGIATKNTDRIAEGVGMALGSFILSKHQPGPAVPMF
jgi:hypothetical protein